MRTCESNRALLNGAFIDPLRISIALRSYELGIEGARSSRRQS
jgi:hypothetical protein